ncbi:MAG: hypothetical protein MI924_25805 [Chloroflexales bacterium]|nr:hypothetical protein [Chloroflexales bacterium]
MGLCEPVMQLEALQDQMTPEAFATILAHIDDITGLVAHRIGPANVQASLDALGPWPSGPTFQPTVHIAMVAIQLPAGAVAERTDLPTPSVVRRVATPHRAAGSSACMQTARLSGPSRAVIVWLSRCGRSSDEALACSGGIGAASAPRPRDMGRPGAAPYSMAWENDGAAPS